MVALALVGCTGWRIAGRSPGDLPAGPFRVRVTLSTGERVEFGRARLEGDSLVGDVDVDSVRQPVRRAIPADSIRRVAVRGETAETRALSFTGGIAVATAAIWFLLATISQ